MAVHRTRKREIADPRSVASGTDRVRRAERSAHSVFSATWHRPRPNSDAVSGIGGGMKIVDIYLSEHERHNAHRAPVVPVAKPVSLTSNRIIQAMLGSAIIAILALAHIHLQFTIRDMRLQHQRMQVGYRELLQQHAHLERQNAFLQDYRRLHAYAVHELGMREITERPIAYVPTQLKEKYSSTATAGERQKVWPPNTMAQTNSRLRTLANGHLAKWLAFGKNAPAGDEVR